MENEALRRLKDELGVINYKINFRRGQVKDGERHV